MDAVPEFEEMHLKLLEADAGAVIDCCTWPPQKWYDFWTWRAIAHPTSGDPCPFWADGQHAWMIGDDNGRICKECHCGGEVKAK